MSDSSLLYLKTVPADAYVLFSTATELQFDHDLLRSEDLFNYLKAAKEEDAASGRFRNNRFAFSKSGKSDSCVRYKHDFEDPYQPGIAHSTPTGFVRVTSSGLFCVHPDNPRVGIDLVYYERTYPENDRALGNGGDAERFLDSLVILPVNRTL